MSTRYVSEEADLINQKEVLRRASLSRHQLRYRLQKKLFPRPSGTSYGRPMWSGSAVDAFVGLQANVKPATAASGNSPGGDAHFNRRRAACAPQGLPSPDPTHTAVEPDLALTKKHATAWERLAQVGGWAYCNFRNLMVRHDIE